MQTKAQLENFKRLIGQIPEPALKKKFNRHTLYRHRSGDRLPSVSTARIYCELLGISLDEFYDKIG